jgi:hypothetical protein
MFYFLSVTSDWVTSADFDKYIVERDAVKNNLSTQHILIPVYFLNNKFNSDGQEESGQTVC